MYCYVDDIRTVERAKKYFIEDLRERKIDPSVCEEMNKAMNGVIVKLSSSAYERETEAGVEHNE